jgi:hypothetical protein
VAGKEDELAAKKQVEERRIGQLVNDDIND